MNLFKMRQRSDGSQAAFRMRENFIFMGKRGEFVRSLSGPVLYNNRKYTLWRIQREVSRQMTVLCVDDHPVLLRGLEQNVRFAVPEADIHGFTNSRDALSYAEGHGCDVLLTEIELYNHGGMRLAEQIKALFPRANIIFVTVCAEKEQAKEVLRLRPSGYLTKPATREQIAEELRNLRYPVPDAAPSLKRTCV